MMDCAETADSPPSFSCSTVASSKSEAIEESKRVAIGRNAKYFQVRHVTGRGDTVIFRSDGTKTPTGSKRSADVIRTAVHVVQTAMVE